MRSGRLKIFAILAVILLVQSLLVIRNGAKKNIFFLDEVFTFSTSMNDPCGWFNQKELLDSWQSGDVYYKFMRVNPDNRFNYRIPYENQIRDVHPPLYYMVFHTICSIFPNVNWKWDGLSINLFFSMLSTLLLYFLAKEISGSDTFSLFSAAFWSWSAGSLSCAIFLRMYAMLTTWTILLALLNARFLKSIDNEDSIRKSTWVGLFMTTAAGILTQYYFLVFCFFLCGFTFVYLVWKKKYGFALRYVATEFAALIVSYFIFPAMRKQIFATGRGKEAFNNFSLGGEWWQHLKRVSSIIRKGLFRGPILPSILLLVLIFLAIGFLQRRKKAESGRKDAAIFALFLIAVSFVLLISRIAPYQTDRYYFCIYPFFVISVLYPLCRTGSWILSKKRLSVVFIGVLILELMFSSRERYINYRYDWFGKREKILSNYLSYPVIALAKANYNTLEYSSEFEKFPSVYRCKARSYEGLKTVKENGGEEYLKKGFLIYAMGHREGFTDEKFIQEISEYLPISRWKRIKHIRGCPVYFCRTEAK